MSSPSKPVDQLITELHQGDFMTRSSAARELGKSRDPRAMEALLPDLQDKDWRVRRNAAQALGAMKAKDAVEPLIQALHDRTMTVRMRAVVALGRIKDPRAIPALVEMLKDREGDVVEGAVQALKKFGKAALPALREALQSPSGPRRLDLLRLMVDIPGTDVFEDLRSLLEDSEPVVRVQALMLLGKTRDPRAVEVIQGRFSDPHPYVQSVAIETMGQFHDSQVIDALLGQLSDHALYGQKREIYRAVTSAFQKIAGFPPEFADVVHNRPATLAGLLSDEQRLDLNLLMSQYAVMLKNITDRESTATDAPQPATVKKIMGLFDQVRGAGNTVTRQVDDLMGMLRHASSLIRVAAAVSLVWYLDARALQPLSVARMDPNPQVHAAADWAYETLLKTLEYRSQLGDSLHGL